MNPATTMLMEKDLSIFEQEHCLEIRASNLFILCRQNVSCEVSNDAHLCADCRSNFSKQL